ncbi:response regulator [Tissierella sp. MB52-C2]|uniref:response regulator n=1 Tax=Tissierella sp. MB52-C2 TaxID=3070999 RepID=UPI00280B52CD|nr:response regulator [Tissierella sp. MB52-C2]WMM25477.1 response regulator [Tissierella sp. MB52-C2]
MKIYIIEDDENIIRILEKIIIDTNLGDIIGKADNGNSGIDEIERFRPDIVLVDLLMPGKDGITLVREAKMIYPDIQYIMISQVSSKDMIAKAYQSGIEYYISKPIDAIEVQTVINKVKEKINMNKKLSQIQSLFSSEPQNIKTEQPKSENLEGVKRVMQRIGLIGEAGSQDILDIAKYLMDTNKSMSDFTIKELCSQFTDNPKTMEQRIRRTATVGMVNLANIGIEDYMNEIFTEYSNGLYNFEQLKIEMDFIRGKTKKRGKVNIKKFLDGMVYYGKGQ